MNIIVVSDIFGNTNALRTLCTKINCSTILDPYDGADMGFKTENEAYEYFTDRVGLDSYFAVLKHKIETMDKPVTLIGFSVGASAIWRLSELNMLGLVNHAICFYGSQIRSFTHIEPTFDMELIFPEIESHFDVCKLMANLINKNMVRTSQVPYLHGFMNLCSTNYNETGYDHHMKKLCSVLLKYP